MSLDQQPTPASSPAEPAVPRARHAVNAPQPPHAPQLAPSEHLAPPVPYEVESAVFIADPAADAEKRRLDIGGEWKGVSKKYLAVEMVGTGIMAVILIAAASVPLFFGLWFGWLTLAAVVILSAILLIIAPRRVRSIRYQLRDDDLLFRKGIMFTRIVAVPYGRMQLIDTKRGPLDRALGLAQLNFVTAAAATGVSIPGIPEKDVEELRDVLVSLAETRRAGL